LNLGGKAESTIAVIDVATRGRKRGLALVAATQRLSKLHKDVAAELLNKLIGRTGLDVDVKRAAAELGLTAREAVSVLRDLQPGEFYPRFRTTHVSLSNFWVPIQSLCKGGDYATLVPP
jgi:DNA helicase HerA-like ATPase